MTEQATGSSPRVSDRVAPGYEEVASAFFSTIEDGRRTGSAVSIWKDGEPVVSLAGGVADAATGEAFTTDTLIPVASVTKGLSSLVVARLVERGDLPGYDTPIREVWPEFDTYGKGALSIGDVLAHRAGLSAPRRSLTRAEILDPLATADVLAAQEPLWEPGASHQYHAFTHGALTAKLVHLATGRSLGALLREEISEPLSAEAWIGLPVDKHARVSELVLEPVALDATVDEVDAEPVSPWVERAMDLGSGIDVVSLVYSAEGMSAELPGVNGVGSASAIAKIWSAAVVETDGVRLISDDTAAALRASRSSGPAEFAGPPPYQAWGAGVMIPSHWIWYLTQYSFGHDGMHGQVAFADPYYKIGFSYLTNRSGDWDRGKAVLAALSRTLR